jgi:hypothetical protein
MKFLASIVLVFFLALIAYPTYSVLVKKFADKNVSYAFSDEENEKESKEVKEVKGVEYISQAKLPNAISFFYARNASKISAANESKRTNFPREILIPPPKLV